MSLIPELAHTVHVGGRAYAAGTIPPVAIARQILNRAAWDGGELPDLDDAEDTEHTQGPADPHALVSAGIGDNAIPAQGDPAFEGPRTDGLPTDGGPGQAATSLPAAETAARPRRTRRTTTP
jgi:hypothetical protein